MSVCVVRKAGFESALSNVICNELVWRGEDNKIHKASRNRPICVIYPTLRNLQRRARAGRGKYRGTPFLARHLYAARLTLHIKKLNCKSCSSRDSLGKDVLGLSFSTPFAFCVLGRGQLCCFFTLPYLYLIGRPCMATHRRTAAAAVSIGLLLRQKSKIAKINGYLKMAPCDSPSKTGIETNLSSKYGHSPIYIWQLVVVQPT